jgi:EmrB/QacA subfamily drug resistance transporter
MKRYVIFSVITLTMLTAAISSTVVAVAFPDIVSSFNTSIIVAGWVLGINQLACTVSMPLVGRIGDVWGNKATFIGSIGLFTFGSLLCALAPNIQTLIIFRFIQGFGMGGYLPAGTSIIADQFSDRRQQFIGLMSSVYAIGTIFGPNLGGWLTTALGWRSNFWIFVPSGFFLLITVLILIPKDRGTSKVVGLDFISAGLLSVVLSAFMLGISLMGNSQQGISWPQVALFFTIGLVSSIVFIRRQAKIKNPIIDIEMLREKRFMAANAYNFVLGFGIFAITSFIPLYAVSIFGMSTFESGLIMTPRSIGVLISSVLISIYLVRLGYRKPMITGTIVTALSLAVLGIVTPDIKLFGWEIDGFILLSLILFVNGIAQGITLPAANNACIELMPERIATITGVRGMFRQIGGAIGISVATLGLHNASSMHQGFFLVLFGTGLILLLSLPIIFMMPKNGDVMPRRKL